MAEEHVGERNDEKEGRANVAIGEPVSYPINFLAACLGKSLDLRDLGARIWCVFNIVVLRTNAMELSCMGKCTPDFVQAEVFLCRCCLMMCIFWTLKPWLSCSGYALSP